MIQNCYIKTDQKFTVCLTRVQEEEEDDEEENKLSPNQLKISELIKHDN